jgi:hypothetical protein
MRPTTACAASVVDSVKVPRTTWKVRRSSVARRKLLGGEVSVAFCSGIADSAVPVTQMCVDRLSLSSVVGGSDSADHHCCDGLPVCAGDDYNSTPNISTLDDHCCFEHDLLYDHIGCRDCCFTTIGRADIQVHAHPLGLARAIFKNCVVKVRVGHDLDDLVALSCLGPVQLHNIRANGWTPITASYPGLCPSFVFLRWLSSMVGT